MEREFEDYLQDIVEAMEKAQGFVKGMTLEQFVADDKTTFAVVRALEIVGEATKHIPARIRKGEPRIPWKDMAGMRDILIHDYVSVDLETVWLTVTETIDEILPRIKKVLSKK